ncbi:unnamed protein product [Discosporangium mesarthrocarpum]
MFRVPYPLFVPLVEDVWNQGWLGSGGADAAGRPGIPLEEKVLSILHILGRGSVLDDMFLWRGCVRVRRGKCCTSFGLRTWSTPCSMQTGTYTHRGANVGCATTRLGGVLREKGWHRLCPPQRGCKN